jgi:hypothetical protein
MSFTSKKNFETTCISIKQVMNMYAFRGFDCVWSLYFMDGLAYTCFENSSFSHISSTCVKVKTSSTHVRNVGECDVFKAHSNIVQCLV